MHRVFGNGAAVRDLDYDDFSAGTESIVIKRIIDDLASVRGSDAVDRLWSPADSDNAGVRTVIAYHISFYNRSLTCVNRPNLAVCRVSSARYFIVGDCTVGSAYDSIDRIVRVVAVIFDNAIFDDSAAADSGSLASDEALQALREKLTGGS